MALDQADKEIEHLRAPAAFGLAEVLDFINHQHAQAVERGDPGHGWDQFIDGAPSLGSVVLVVPAKVAKLRFGAI